MKYIKNLWRVTSKGEKVLFAIIIASQVDFYYGIITRDENRIISGLILTIVLSGIMVWSLRQKKHDGL